MPLLVDDAKGLDGGGQTFDLQASLFWQNVPCLVKQADREDTSEDLTFRILSGVSRANHNMRILRIHISSETDLFFLHSLEVSEEDFQSLKNEQGILVDFASFPGKVITLLDKCINSQPTDAPRFQAVLSTRGSESVFRIMETNDFKQLPHITLAFRPGNDAAVKQFLAFRLLEVKGNAAELSASLQEAEGARDTCGQQLRSTQQQLAALQEAHDKHVMEVEAEAKTQRATAQEERLKEKSEMRDAFAKELAELQRRHAEQLDTVNARCAELETANRKLREIKYELDTKVSELSHRSGTAEGVARSLEDEVARLRAQATQLTAERHDREAAASEARSRMVVLDEKVAAQVEMIEQQKSRIRDLETSVRQLEGRCGDMRDAAAGHEARLRDAHAEINKGNQIIEKLTNDLKLLKEKIKRKQAIIIRQEEELQAREAALASDEREMRSLTASLEASKAEVLDLRAEVADLRAKLEDSKGQLQSNEQMIRWLNQQVTEAQLHSTNVVPGSRYQYRPALPGPGTAAASTIKPYSPLGSAGSPSSRATPALASATAARLMTDYATPSSLRPEAAAVAGGAAVSTAALRYPGR